MLFTCKAKDVWDALFIRIVLPTHLLSNRQKQQQHYARDLTNKQTKQTFKK